MMIDYRKRVKMIAKKIKALLKKEVKWEKLSQRILSTGLLVAENDLSVLKLFLLWTCPYNQMQ